ncbi:hypothetical protein BC941DRAFT_180483 [Chlamydoabsidia padenii]|nr:hypothetical protein BC941DRAFT_180483 [Chlamydoabsidia padenii]
MMEESVCVDTATPSDNSSGQPTSASQEQEQQLLPSSQDQDNHHTTSHDEYTRWILTASQKKAQREAKLQRKKRSTDTGAALAHTTAHSDNEKDGDNKVVLQDDNDSNWDGISNNIMGTTTNSLLTDGQCGSKPLQKSLQMFDPLNTSKDIVRDTELMEQQQQQPRRRHASVGGITTGGGRASQKPATAPTRLPTPKSSSVISSLPASTTRPRTTKRFSSLDGINSQRRRQQQQQRTTTNWLDLDSHESTVIPIVPRKQDTRRPVSMISSSVEKSSTGAWDTVDFKGKANQQLVDFDPFLAHDPLERKDAFKVKQECLAKQLLALQNNQDQLSTHVSHYLSPRYRLSVVTKTKKQPRHSKSIHHHQLLLQKDYLHATTSSSNNNNRKHIMVTGSSDDLPC